MGAEVSLRHQLTLLVAEQEAHPERKEAVLHVPTAVDREARNSNGWCGRSPGPDDGSPGTNAIVPSLTATQISTMYSNFMQNYIEGGGGGGGASGGVLGTSQGKTLLKLLWWFRWRRRRRKHRGQWGRRGQEVTA